MRMPVVRGTIDRRILLNFRVEPEFLAAELPAPFRPQLVNGLGVAGVCLIRLAAVRPRGLPGWVGLRSENAAHRIAVEWDAADGTRTGVYIPRRDTSSWLNVMAGGRVFPGEHGHARFDVEEQGSHYQVALCSDDQQVRVSLAGHVCQDLPADSLFGSLAAASAFFREGSLGYSPATTPGTFDGLELACRNWSVTPLAVETWSSSFFEDPARFPPGSAKLDSALLMRGVEHEWHARPALTGGLLGMCPA